MSSAYHNMFYPSCIYIDSINHDNEESKERYLKYNWYDYYRKYKNVRQYIDIVFIFI